MNQDLWIIQEETRVFDIDMHLIWITEENLEDIITPEGYYQVKIDTVIIKHKKYARVYFKNNVPVEAQLYKNKKTKETSYYFAGKVLEKQKVKTINYK